MAAMDPECLHPASIDNPEVSDRLGFDLVRAIEQISDLADELLVTGRILYQEHEGAEKLARDWFVTGTQKLASDNLHVLQPFLARLWSMWGAKMFKVIQMTGVATAVDTIHYQLTSLWFSPSVRGRVGGQKRRQDEEECQRGQKTELLGNGIHGEEEVHGPYLWKVNVILFVPEFPHSLEKIVNMLV